MTAHTCQHQQTGSRLDYKTPRLPLVNHFLQQGSTSYRFYNCVRSLTGASQKDFPFRQHYPVYPISQSSGHLRMQNAGAPTSEVSVAFKSLSNERGVEFSGKFLTRTHVQLPSSVARKYRNAKCMINA